MILGEESMAQTISIGKQDFLYLRENNYFYIDKTDFIRQWWESADDITLLEIVEAMQGPIAVLDCLLPGADCDRLRTCIARRVWLDVSQSISRKLGGISIRSILARGPSR
jgi:hypothetical protein